MFEYIVKVKVQVAQQMSHLNYKEKNYDLMIKNSFDDYIFNSLYNNVLVKKEIIAETELIETVLSLSEEKMDDC